MYPVMLNLENKRVLIVGGGEVAAKKTKMLLGQNAKICVVSPSLSQLMHTYYMNGNIEWVNREFNSNDTKNAFLVIAATNNRNVNECVLESCNENQLVNIVDSPKDSTFYNMAYFERGKLKIAISTEGASPMLAKQIKSDLTDFFDESYEEYLKFLLTAREKIKLLVNDENRKHLLLQDLLHEKYRKDVQERELFLANIT